MKSRAGKPSRKRRDQVQTVIDRSNFKDLSVATIVAALHEKEIRSLEELAGQLQKALADPRGRPQPIDFSRVAHAAAERENPGVRHPEPKIPFVWNGTTYDPADISRLDGRTASFLVRFVGGRPEMYVIDDPHLRSVVVQTAAMGRFVDSVKGPSKDLTESAGYAGLHFGPAFLDGAIIVAPPPFTQGSQSIPATDDLRLWSDDRFQGTGLTVPAFKAYSDLTAVYSFWPFSDWNDCITSAMPCKSPCIFWEHIDFAGSFLLIDLHLGVNNFADFGWNDRISSVWNLG